MQRRARRASALLAPVRGDEHDALLLFRHDNAEGDRVVLPPCDDGAGRGDGHLRAS
jgi:hypothetical protein